MANEKDTQFDLYTKAIEALYLSADTDTEQSTWATKALMDAGEIAEPAKHQWVHTSNHRLICSECDEFMGVTLRNKDELCKGSSL